MEFIMKKVIYIISFFLLLTSISSSQDFKKLNNLQNGISEEVQKLGDPTTVGNDGLPKYFKGRVYVKLKNNTTVNLQQTSKTKQLNSFGIEPLDNNLRKFGVMKVEKTFNLSTELSPRIAKRKLSSPINSNALSSIYTVYFDEKYSCKEIVKSLTNNPEIEYVEPVPIYYITETPNDPSYAIQQHLPQMRCPEAWDLHKGQNGDGSVLIGICDSGVDWKHNDLIGNLYNNLGEDADKDGHTIEWNGSTWVFDPGDVNGKDDDGNGYIDDFSGWNFWTSDATQPNNIMVTSSNAHGTHCAGISAGVTNNATGISSVSWNLKFIGTKHGDNRYGNAIYYGFEGIVYLAEQGADVVNCSWGGGGYSIAGQEAINYATSLGCIVVAAAGNNNSGSNFYPAAYDNVFSVSSVAVTDKKSYYSNYGYYVDVSAPGGDAYVDGGILSTIPGNNYAKFQGTSMAAPQVTGLIGYVKSYLPEITNDNLIRRIIGNTDPIDALNPSYIGKLGSGRINAHKALLFNAPQKLPLKLVTNGIYYQKEFDYYKVGFDISNYSLDGAENVKFEITTNNPNLEIMQSTGYGPLSANSTTKTDYFVSFKILNHKSEWATINLRMTGLDNSIQVGAEYSFNIYLGENSVLIYEKLQNGATTSGKYIRDYLTSNNYPNVVYTNNTITNFIGFNYAFMTMGNGNSSDFSAFGKIQASATETFLKNGGKLFLESGEALGYEQAGNKELLELFGISNGFDGIASHTFAGLTGGAGTIAEGMQFTSTTQNPYGWIDYFNLSTGQNVFFEPGIGIVGVQNIGAYGQRTFAFSYTLSKLIDAVSPSTKTILLQRLLAFLGLYNSVPIKAILETPNNNEKIPSTSDVTFSWQSLPNVWDYQLQISEYSDFRTCEYDNFVQSNNSIYSSGKFLINKLYYWRIRGRNNFGNGPWSDVRNFKVILLPPAQTVLSFPSNNSTINTLRPTFQWNAVPGAIGYTLEISKTSNFTVDYQKYTGIYTNSFYLYASLEHNTTYYWRVTARNQGGSGPASQVWAFKVYICSEKPVLSLPVNDAFDQEFNPILEWYSVKYASSYNLLVSENSDFSNSMEFNGISSTSYQLSGLSQNKTYFWKVRTLNDCGYSDFSEVRNFRTKIIPFTINLENKATCYGQNIELGYFKNGVLSTVTGGSGSFEFKWNPSYNLINANTGNPTVINPTQSKVYFLTVTDLITSAVKSKLMVLNIYSQIQVKLPDLVTIPAGSLLDLNNHISNITGGEPPYRISWFDISNNKLDPPILTLSSGYYNFKIVVQDVNGCSTSGTLNVLSTKYKKDISENTVISNNNSILLSIYPNPIFDKIFYSISLSQQETVTLEISDLNGKIIRMLKLAKNSSSDGYIDMSNLPSGIYFINAIAGEEIVGQKVIKK